MTLKQIDRNVYNLIKLEEERQKENLQMIPSENYTSKAVREAVGSVLMHKYSEGQIGKRYYQGNKLIDKIETLAKTRALKLFGLNPKEWAVNVQAVTGSIANFAVLTALLEPGDKILSMNLFDGGHLSHGWKANFSSKIFNVNFYTTNPKTRILNYDKVRKQAGKFKPKIIISGGTAYPREINHKKMGEIAKSVGAYYLADVAHEAGLVAAKVNVSPFEHADVITMTTRKTLRGPVGALIFCKKELEEKINKAVFPGLLGGPQNHSIAGIAVALKEARTKAFEKYAKQTVTNAKTLAKELKKYGFDVVSGGTDKHLVLVDLRNKNTDGSKVAEDLEKAGIIVNKNTVPKETASPFHPSGIRLGTPALTSRGMKEKGMKIIAKWINIVVENPQKALEIKKDVKKLCAKFPISF